ncbi:3'-5' exonuclease [Photobacterium rosenbergii]|uniref:3'-5' exonuclease n=1 Tax=Photobacterium rosenbergii TaxID=294936 RepID=A0ABU3ZBY5_9GAMM|nr:3'-5' exonuclease [Photobacterium rosenbergii]MDV5167498.1 3'-5' exonuclease [Photobacterium rosenbergii]
MKPISLDNAVILDTETTGLNDFAEIVELSVMDAKTGQPLLDTLVMPAQLVPGEAMAIHGITNRMLVGASTFPIVYKQLAQAIKGRDVLIYNAAFDVRLIRQSLNRYGIDLLPFKTQCVMEWYAEFFGEWNEYHGNYKWQSLTNAAVQQGIDISDLKAHRAMADCEITRRLLLAVNEQLGGKHD